MFPHIQYGEGGGCEMMIRAIGVVFFLLLVSGCCVVDTFTYEPTIDEQLERERDKKKNPVLLPIGFSC